MKTQRLLSLLGIFLILSTFIVVGVTPPTFTLAQSCTVVDTFTASGVTGTGVTFPGTYNMIAGRRYTVTLTGTGVRGDGWLFDPGYADDHGVWVSPFRDGGFRYGNGQRNMPSSYSSSHTYTVDMFGNGAPFTISTLSYANASVTFSFDVSVCEETQPYTLPYCSIISTLSITQPSASPVTGPTLTNGATYDLYIAGEFISDGANLDDYFNKNADPAAYTTNDWSTQTFPYNPPQGNVGVVAFTAANYTLVTSTYQSSHFYHATIDGLGVPVQFNLGGGWFLYGGGFVAYICDRSITPTPTATGTLAPTATPTQLPAPTMPGALPARVCSLLGDANANGKSGHTWQLTGGAAIPPISRAQGIYFNNFTGQARLPMRLNRNDKYRLEITYLSTQTSLQGQFSLKLGGGEPLPINILATSATQSKIFPAANFTPDPDGLYNLLIDYAPPNGYPTFIVTFVCVTKVTSLAPGDTTPEPYKVCETCSKPDDFLDLGGWFRWLGCLLRQVWECVIVPILSGIWKWLGGVLGYLIAGFFWLASVFSNGARQVLAYFFIVLYYVNQFLTNLAQSIINGAAQAVNSEGSIIGFVRGFYEWGAGLLTFVASILTNALSLIPRIVGIIYIIASGVLQGINNPNGYSVVIADNSLLNFLSLSFYVLDSTIFEGPVWYLVPMVMAFVSWTVLLWAKRQLLKVAAPTSAS